MAAYDAFRHWRTPFVAPLNQLGRQATVRVLTAGLIGGPRFGAREANAQHAALLGFVRAGGGFVGVHFATDTSYAWPDYRELIGGYLKVIPGIKR